MSGERDSFSIWSLLGFCVALYSLCERRTASERERERETLAILKQRINNAVYLKYCHFCRERGRNPALLGNEYDIRR